MPVKLSQTGLDPADPALQGLFGDLQGNILKSHGRDHSRHVFLCFTATAEAARNWVSSFARRVTSASEQHRTARDYRTTGTEHLFTGFMLSGSGYEALGVDLQVTPDDKAFRAGMKNLDAIYDTGPLGVHARSANPLNDDPQQWDAAFRQRIDALVVLAYGGQSSGDQLCSQILDEAVRAVALGLDGIAEVVSVQSGFALRNANGHVIEHFGYADGASNPLFMLSDLQEADQEGRSVYDPSAPVGLVLVQDPGGGSADDSFGTYFVYRKLQQNVRGFRDRVQALAATLAEAGGTPVDATEAGALVIGRHMDGTPVSLMRQRGPGLVNNFTYDDDPDGLRCPFHAHTRKTNPRGDTARVSGVPLRSERAKRIVRRGISYGAPDLNPTEEWTDAGLLFLSCQSDIEQQFLVMHAGWANNPGFLAQKTGLDPVIGQGLPGDQPSEQQWPTGPDGARRTVAFSFNGFVRCRGGEYFFAPSLSFLAALSHQPLNGGAGQA